MVVVGVGLGMVVEVEEAVVVEADVTVTVAVGMVMGWKAPTAQHRGSRPGVTRHTRIVGRPSPVQKSRAHIFLQYFLGPPGTL